MDRSSASRKPMSFEKGSGEIDELEYSSEEAVDAEEKIANLRRKGKEIMVQDVIVVDDDWSLHTINEVKLGGSYKGKGLLFASSSESDSDDKKAPFFMEQSSSSTSAATDAVVNCDYSNSMTKQSSDTDIDDINYSDDDDELEYVPEKGWYNMNEISYLQTQFEKSDIPPDIEVDIPWWSDPGRKNSNPFNLSGPPNESAAQLMLDYETAISTETKSAGGSVSSTDIGCMNGSNPVPFKHGYLPNNCAAESSVPAQTETPGGSSGTLQPTSLIKEAAMVRVQQFEKFAVVEDYSDHHYFNRSRDMQLEKASAKKIMDEWKILQSSLPDTIFVRVYESQMALLRAVIIGPQGTPYHDGLFFFDVMLPSNYPERPPHVYFYSGGLRLNPNLYGSGKVCLSLLGTWPGQCVTENWIPGKSTLLQVLVSIQGLILNAKPYFNEPGFSSYGDNNASELYNEGTLLNSLKTMIYSMKKPPRHFEEFVPDYFITRSRDIILACNEYMKGAKVGSVSVVDGKAVKEDDKWCSPNFKDRLGCYLNSLIDEFTKLGVNDCDEFRVPASNIKEAAVALDSSGHSAWTEMPSADPHFSSMVNIFTHTFGKAKFKKSSSQFMSVPVPTAPGVPHPYLIRPSDIYAAPYLAALDNAHPIPPSDMHAAYPAAAPGDAYPIGQSSTTTTSQLQFPHLVAYPSPPPPLPPHIAMSLSSATWIIPSLSLPVHAERPVRFGSLQSHEQNIRPVINAEPSARPQPPPPHTQNVHPAINPNPPARFRPARPPTPYMPSGRKQSKPDDELKGNVHRWSDC